MREGGLYPRSSEDPEQFRLCPVSPSQGWPAPFRYRDSVSPHQAPPFTLAWDLVTMLALSVVGMLWGGVGTRVVSTHRRSREAFALQCQEWGQGLLGTGGGCPPPIPSP